MILGHRGNIAYRLISGVESLVAGKKFDQDPAEELMPSHLLGVNLNVESVRPSQHPGRSRRKMSLADESEKSNNSAEQDDVGVGFVSHQLGELEYSFGLELSNKTTINDLIKAKWRPSGFVVVVEINKSNGCAAAVYIL